MWEEARMWIKDVGFPICVAVIAIYALFRMFTLRESDRLKVENAAKQFADLAASGNSAISENTSATKELTSTIKAKLGSDPDNLCKAEMVLKKAGITCKVEEVAKVLERLEKKK